MKDILPLGSIVKMKARESAEVKVPRIMVIGRFLINGETGEVCDYMGLAYPFGFQGTDAIIYFNEDSIDEVVFEGYLDEEEIVISQQIIKELNKKRAELEGK